MPRFIPAWKAPISSARPEERGGGDLLRLRGPGADVPEDVGHPAPDDGRHEAPADAQARRAERLRDGVEEDRVGREVGQEADRRRVDGASERERPVDLVVEEVEGAAPAPGAVAVLREDELAELPQLFRGDDGPGRVRGRVQDEEAGAPEVRGELLGRREEVRRGVDRDLHRPRAGEVDVVVVVPRRDRVEDRRRRDRGASGRCRRGAAGPRP